MDSSSGLGGVGGSSRISGSNDRRRALAVWQLVWYLLFSLCLDFLVCFSLAFRISLPFSFLRWQTVGEQYM